ncbi:MAG: hypothetical protein WCO19_01510 [Candidatus Saccharibacteria bacterium]
MDLDRIPAAELEKRRSSFEDYRALCDLESSAFRPIGLTDPTLYELAMNDEATVLIDTENGSVPAVFKLEFSEGFDIERCRTLACTPNVYLLGIPASLLMKPVIIPENSAVIVESDEKDYDEDRTHISRIFHDSKGDSVTCEDFLDPRINDSEHKAASMSIYSSLATNLRAESGGQGTNMTIKEAFNSTSGELIPKNGMTLFDRTDLLAHPEIAEELWQLFKNRFEWLGDFHPVSMEDTREVFDDIVLSETTFTPLKIVDGKIVCAGIIVNNMEDISWLKDSTISDINRSLDNNTKSMYFFGIAALEGDDKAIDNMQDVVHFHCKLSAITGNDFMVVFESTNMSSIYIPRITQQYINSSGVFRMDDSLTANESIRYWFARSSSK